MAIPLLLLKPTGSRDRNGPVTPTITGDVPVVAVNDRAAWQVWEGTTNLVANPHGITTSGWAAGNANLTVTAITEAMTHPIWGSEIRGRMRSTVNVVGGVNTLYAASSGTHPASTLCGVVLNLQGSRLKLFSLQVGVRHLLPVSWQRVIP